MAAQSDEDHEMVFTGQKANDVRSYLLHFKPDKRWLLERNRFWRWWKFWEPKYDKVSCPNCGSSRLVFRSFMTLPNKLAKCTRCHAEGIVVERGDGAER